MLFLFAYRLTVLFCFVGFWLFCLVLEFLLDIFFLVLTAFIASLNYSKFPRMLLNPGSLLFSQKPLCSPGPPLISWVKCSTSPMFSIFLFLGLNTWSYPRVASLKREINLHAFQIRKYISSSFKFGIWN